MYLTLLYGEWNTKYSASEIENCLPAIFSYLVSEIAVGQGRNLKQI
jgi:hypothetical protein